jgi:hypothetical protein
MTTWYALGMRSACLRDDDENTDAQLYTSRVYDNGTCVPREEPKPQNPIRCGIPIPDSPGPHGSVWLLASQSDESKRKTGKNPTGLEDIPLAFHSFIAA